MTVIAARIRRTAHDPGDPLVANHCPFCGSGQVLGRSDGNIECDFCGMVFIVRVQPMYSGMPQMPGQPGAPTDTGPDLMQGMEPGGSMMMGPDGQPVDPGALGPDGMPMDDGEGELGPDGEPLPPDELGDDGAPPWASPEGEDEGGGGDEGEDPGKDTEGSGDDHPEKPSGKSKDKKKPPPKSTKKGALASRDTPENRRHYNRGWRASTAPATKAELAGGPSALERADDRGEPSAWHDGYSDAAIGRAKGHSLVCGDRDHQDCDWDEGFGVAKKGTYITVDQARAAYRERHGDRDPNEVMRETVARQERLFLTMAGDALTEGQYIRHLAVLHSGSDPRVLAALRKEAHGTEGDDEWTRHHLVQEHEWGADDVRQMEPGERHEVHRADHPDRFERAHEDMSESEMRQHMLDQHGYGPLESDDPHWLIEQTHRDEHAEPQDHVHPDLESGSGPDQFSWQPSTYIERPRSMPELMDHMSGAHGSSFTGDKTPAPRFLISLHDKFHDGELADRRTQEHHHEHHDPVFGSARMTDLHGHLHDILRQRHHDWDNGLIEDARLGDRFDRPSMTLHELSDELYQRGGKAGGPNDIEHALQDLAGRGHVRPSPVYGEWEWAR